MKRAYNSAYRKAYYAKNKAKIAKKKGPAWLRARSKKYAKKYQDLTEKQKETHRACYRAWYLKNKNRRKLYARQYRRRNPTFGLKQAIGTALQTRDIGTLTQIYSAALKLLDE